MHRPLHTRKTELSSSSSPGRSLVDTLAAGGGTFALSFAGQGSAPVDVLAELYLEHASIRALVDDAQGVIDAQLGHQRLRWSGMYGHGLQITDWLADAGTRPPDAYLLQSHISHPLVLLAQLSRYLVMLESGLEAAVEAGALTAVTGHSQGLLAALLLSESAGRRPTPERIAAVLAYAVWQGFWTQSGRPSQAGEGDCMVAVSGPREADLAAVVARVRDRLPAEHGVYISLQNTPTRAVVSGTPQGLTALQLALESRRERELADRKAGRRGGRPLAFTWDPLAVGAPFHCPFMEPVRTGMEETVRELGMTFGPLKLPVYNPNGEGCFESGPGLMQAVVDNQFIQPVHWCRTVRTLAAEARPDWLIDCGPGESAARLAQSSLRGFGMATIASGTPGGQEALFTVGAELPRGLDWSVYAPRLSRLSSGETVLDTRYTRATGQSPIILAGMTPTTVEVPICAAAANAGFTAELAGGGQVTEHVFEARMDELASALQPGAEVVFNALLLDPWLFGLHLGDKALVQKARARGIPLRGVTLSGGVPDVERGVALLHELAALGMHHNAFKPGTLDQVDQVLRIAAGAPEHVVFVHLEGGRAGGHHSWEDLDELLLLSYARLRAAPNVVLCVGGGVAEPGRAAELLTGRWALAWGEPAMPVDAVFLGTVAMAVAESSASPSVKAALVGAEGCEDWVATGGSGGGITSGRSGLDADIHYLDNPAARCGRLLDQVAGKADAVAARRDEIIEALNATAKPYLGELEAMSYGAVLDRMVELMAVGRGTPYEDGCWPDRSFRQRVLDVYRRAEARCHPQDAGEIESLVTAADLDDPRGALRRLREALPEVDEALLHPVDADWFVRSVCARPGKPVNFVPVIDADVRRWYKADSLWQAQDDRFEADQVLVLPGPAGVAGIDRADEPVAELLGRFEDGVVASLLGSGEQPVLRETRRLVEIDEDAVHVEVHGDRVRLSSPDGVRAHAWADYVASRFDGPIAALFAAERVSLGDERIDNPLRTMAVSAADAFLEVTHLDRRVHAAVWRDRVRHESLWVRLRDDLTLDVSLSDDARLRFRFAANLRADGWAFELDPGDHEAELRAFYGATLLGRALPAAVPFEPATLQVALGAERAQAHAAITGGTSTAPDLAFSAAWQAVLGALSVQGVGRDMLRLVHLEHGVTCAGDPARLSGELTATARIVSLEVATGGRTIEVAAELSDEAGLVAELRERFFVRDPSAQGSARRERRLVREQLVLDEAGAAFLSNSGWLGHVEPGDVSLDLTVVFDRSEGVSRADVQGTISQHGARDVQHTATGDWTRHPVLAALDLLRADTSSSTPRRRLAEATHPAPTDMRTFAEVGGDLNPIHTSGLLARLAGLGGPIVHGMWSSAALQAFVVRSVAGGDASRLASWDVRFVDVVPPGAQLTFEVHRTGVSVGDLVVEAVASVDGGAVVTARARVAAPRTAVVFPGQGIQRRGMGMEAYADSRAARAVWDRADAHTRTSLGFSILAVVRDNPTTVRVGGDWFGHPEGVLHLTRFTQVAMSVLASAQTAQLREAGVLGDDVVFAGHSIGEYNALSALAGVLPLETVVDVVYLRGATMEDLVPRDARGRSPYAMAAVRPRMAGLDEAGLVALVAELRQSVGFLEIVNFNIRDLQYAITGELAALEALERAIVARVPEGGKPAWTMVPGIDVPFHSTRLRPGVATFRELLERVLPVDVAADVLVGRYVPNLVARPFSLDDAFVDEMIRVTGDSSLQSLKTGPDRARRTLVELLAWQFASPVRWVETQELLLSTEGLGVQCLLEVGVDYQPTIRNMAAHTLRQWPGLAPVVELLNVGADAERVFLTDEEPAPVEEEVEPEVEPELAPESAAEAAPVAPVAVHTAPVSAGPVPDTTLPLHDALRILLALQAHVRPDQLRDDETIDELFDGVSSKRNQVLLDLGAEFGVGTIDAAHERPLVELATELSSRCGGYRVPGPFLSASVDTALRRSLGLSRRDLDSHLETRWSFGPGNRTQVALELALGLREGASLRGGELGSGVSASTRAEAVSVVDDTVTTWAARQGIVLATAEVVDAAADPAALRALREELLGDEGLLLTPFKALAERLGHKVEDALPQIEPELERLKTLDAELGVDTADALAPRFDRRRHVCFDDAWSLARRDLVALAYGLRNGTVDDADRDAELRRLSLFSDDPELTATARWFADVIPDLGEAPAPWGDGTEAAALLRDYQPEGLQEALGDSLRGPWSFAGRTAVVTGASPGSIALDIVRHLLRGGARVVVTTSRASAERIAAYREVYRGSAAPGAELHVVPFNQASRQDAEALVSWLFERVTEQAGAEVRELKPAFAPDLIIPFAAAGDVATLDQVDGRSEVALRTLLLGVERLVTGVARRYLDEGELAEPCQVLLPLSPNHGTFGGDGLYGECKAALEAMVNRWTSEQEAWGRAVAISAATIGWVRGTGLMAGNDSVAGATGARTFSTAEMGWLLAALCTPSLRRQAAQRPLRVDLSGGLADTDLATVVGQARLEQVSAERLERAVHKLAEQHARRMGARPAEPAVQLLPSVITPSVPTTERRHPVDLSRTVVLVGMGEVGPCGSSRTRHALEVGDELTPAAVLELAWITGLVRYDAHSSSWLDAESGEAVPEHELCSRYGEAVRERVGVRFVEPEVAGFDPDQRPVLQVVRLERDFRFAVADESEARSFLAADADHTRIGVDDGTWFVTRTAGAELRMPRAVRLSCRVAGMLPTGMQLERWGVGPELQASVDRLALLNLVATVEAFASAGLTPEELLRHVHPSRVGNTQGTGIGGVQSMRRMYTDQLLDEPRQHDILQESLGNVVAAWVVQSYIGSYGPMTHPVAACATAAVSVECGVDKILAGKAEFVVAGGFDDIGMEGVVGFGDMHATAETAEMTAMGLAPSQMSRSNDARRRGFVEAQGGGTLLLARGDVAVRMGLPVQGVVAYAAGFGDGVHTSIPAPGKGLLGAVSGGAHSPMASALQMWGLTADDIGLVYKHDTSTAANDPNEAELHHRMQEVLGRTPGNPLLVVSQKTLTGHAKGGAAAWQLIGLAQAMRTGLVPGNRNLTCLDGGLRRFTHLLHTDSTLRPGRGTPLRAGLITSLGFGHVNAIVLLLHPSCFVAALDDAQREAWSAAATAREAQAQATTWSTWMGRAPAFVKRVDRRVVDAQHEVDTLLDPASRLGADGIFGGVA